MAIDLELEENDQEFRWGDGPAMVQECSNLCWGSLCQSSRPDQLDPVMLAGLLNHNFHTHTQPLQTSLDQISSASHSAGRLYLPPQALCVLPIGRIMEHVLGHGR